MVEDAGGESPQILNVGQMEAVTRELKERADTGAGWIGRGLDNRKVGNRGDYSNSDF